MGLGLIRDDRGLRSGYVPIPHGFEDAPELIHLTALLRREGETYDSASCRTEAKCRRVWSWIDRVSKNACVRGDVDQVFEQVDGVVRCPGFGLALEVVGWLRRTDDGVEFPNIRSWIEGKERRLAKGRADKRLRNGPSAEKRRARTRRIGRCVYCGSQKNIVCDHFVPIAKGGKDADENVVPACAPCNGAKSDRVFGSIEEAAAWLRKRRGMVEVVS